MKKNIFVLFLLLLTMATHAQISIKGKVTDTDGTPLIGASVSLPELNKGTITNQAGEYTLSNIPKGKIKIRFSYVGFNTQIKTPLK